MTDIAKPTPHSPGTGDSAPSTPPGDRGRTTIAVGVVEKIAGMAAREVEGIHALGSGSRGFGAVRERVPGTRPNVSKGVKAEVGEKQAALDIDLIVEYDVPIHTVARSVRSHVIEAVERSTGLQVVECNISVNDVHLPDEQDEDESSESRVQ
ncbi:Asp23/Gls24 family envelope stress response protein [Streptacidiphilus sp. PB12-B1b]|uniref:Asp23/Gls24 family envelope stress response protein n=1 Tax=Streptacidiphilus sp. PB12-B1b TaxID=2705012 RepID=UPI0015F81E0B|nr:Asp23/Gls24 family envelope stress response protein [Streptacidiphilus sp. PB12-B1b]QMU78523.1 Asp23/Gls24 family envelope stress response protein [Streptacidiphilus sp. PB12-B1b]